MQVAIIEDEQIAVAHLHQLIGEVDESIAVVKTLDSIAASVEYLESARHIDLLFMDIELGDGQSFEIFNQIPVSVPVIFTTAYEHHALKAFKHHSVDYLLKPIKKNELQQALQKFHRFYADEQVTGPATITEYKTRFLARVGTRMVSIPLENIAYFYTKDRLQYLKTLQNDDYVLDKPLDEIESSLNPSQFFRANRQFVIGYAAVQKAYAWHNGKLKVLVDPAPYEEIIISRLRATDFKKWLGE